MCVERALRARVLFWGAVAKKVVAKGFPCTAESCQAEYDSRFGSPLKSARKPRAKPARAAAAEDEGEPAEAAPLPRKGTLANRRRLRRPADRADPARRRRERRDALRHPDARLEH